MEQIDLSEIQELLDDILGGLRYQDGRHGGLSAAGRTGNIRAKYPFLGWDPS